MRHYSEPALVALAQVGNLTDHVEHNAASIASKDILAIADGDGWRYVTASQFRSEVRSIAKGLIADGIQAGERVAIFSRTRYEWTVADYAIWYAGAITVPIYETSSASQVQWIMSDADVVATFFEAARTTSAYNDIADKVANMSRTYIFKDNVFAELTARGAHISDDVLDERRRLAGPDSLATIIYTSGTTGQPKGCMLTHGNFMNEVDNLVAGYPEIFAAPGGSTLMFLPLAHVFGRTIQVAMIRAGVTMAHCPNPAGLVRDLGTFKPTFLLAVPRIFEKVFNGASAKAHEAGGAKAAIFDAAVSTSIAYSKALDAGSVSPLLRAKHALFDVLVYKKLRALLGNRVSIAISGGAALGARLGHFYRGLGIMVLEGYGLTETTAGAVLNRPKQFKIGTVGLAVFGTEVMIDDDGEVLLKGHEVFKGYWNNEQATAEAFDAGGWFHSGDLGSLDSEGYLTITGRKKELIVTAGGKNVAPAILEDRLRSQPIISQCMVVGDGQAYVAALVTLDQDALPAILRQHDIPDAPLEQLVTHPKIRKIVQDAVNYTNEAVSNSEAIKKFVILPTDWTVENGYLTPKLSIKRHVVSHDFAKEIAAIYA